MKPRAGRSPMSEAAAYGAIPLVPGARHVRGRSTRPRRRCSGSGSSAQDEFFVSAQAAAEGVRISNARRDRRPGGPQALRTRATWAGSRWLRSSALPVEEALQRVGGTRPGGARRLVRGERRPRAGSPPAPRRRPGAGLEFDVHPDRALDIGAATFDGVPLAWLSSTGISAPSRYEHEGPGWLRTFGGGLLTTCGLDSFGPPADDEDGVAGMHGRIGTVPAHLTDQRRRRRRRITVAGHGAPDRRLRREPAAAAAHHQRDRLHGVHRGGHRDQRGLDRRALTWCSTT